MIIPIHLQDEPNPLVFRPSGFVVRSLQITLDMRLAHASPEARNPARLSLILKVHWNNALADKRLLNRRTQRVQRRLHHYNVTFVDSQRLATFQAVTL